MATVDHSNTCSDSEPTCNLCKDPLHSFSWCIHSQTLNNVITTLRNVAQQEEIAALVALKEKDPGSGRSSESDSSDSEVVSFSYGLSLNSY